MQCTRVHSHHPDCEDQQCHHQGEEEVKLGRYSGDSRQNNIGYTIMVTPMVSLMVILMVTLMVTLTVNLMVTLIVNHKVTLMVNLMDTVMKNTKCDQHSQHSCTPVTPPEN